MIFKILIAIFMTLPAGGKIGPILKCTKALKLSANGKIEVSEFHVIICWSLGSKIGDCQLQRHSSQLPQFFEVFSKVFFHADLNYILEFRTSFYKGLFFLNTSRDTLAKK